MRAGVGFVLAAVVTLTAAGCGSSTAAKVARDARAQEGASGATCRREGVMVFVGKRETVYDCTLTDVPPDQRAFQHFDRATQHRCFVHVAGATTDVTVQLDRVRQAGASAGSFACTR